MSLIIMQYRNYNSLLVDLLKKTSATQSLRNAHNSELKLKTQYF